MGALESRISAWLYSHCSLRGSKVSFLQHFIRGCCSDSVEINSKFTDIEQVCTWLLMSPATLRSGCLNSFQHNFLVCLRAVVTFQLLAVLPSYHLVRLGLSWRKYNNGQDTCKQGLRLDWKVNIWIWLFMFEIYVRIHFSRFWRMSRHKLIIGVAGGTASGKVATTY